MLALSNPYVVLSLVAALGFSHWYAYDFGKGVQDGDQAKEQRIAQVAYEASQKAAAEAIAGIKVEHRTVHQKVERIIHENPVYRDCRHDPDGLRALNEAITGKPQPASDRKLP